MQEQQNETIYNKFGQITSETDFNSDTINYPYDTYGRLENKTFTNPQIPSVKANLVGWAKTTFLNSNQSENHLAHLCSITGEVTDVRGDFRFQGQWLDEGSDFYHFRARYYDLEVGRFVSRDPVDIIEYEPESSNPYQFVYNNPHVYSDPTGMFTITELNAAQNLQDALASIRRYANTQAKDYLIERLGESFGNVVASIFNNFLPGTSLADSFVKEIFGSDISDIFELEISDMLCQHLEGIPLANSLRFFPRIARDGTPLSPGLICSDRNNQTNNSRVARRISGLPGSRPDFIFIQGNFRENNPNSYLIGDFKLTQAAARRDIIRHLRK
ncbi:MAG: RHS repeat-associated core domain-containing protein [Spirulinaceae cyanobacterium]